MKFEFEVKKILINYLHDSLASTSFSASFASFALSDMVAIMFEIYGVIKSFLENC